MPVSRPARIGFKRRIERRAYSVFVASTAGFKGLGCIRRGNISARVAVL